MTVKDPDVLTYSETELRALQAAITDPNYRIFADREGHHRFQQRPLRARDRHPGDLRAA